MSNATSEPKALFHWSQPFCNFVDPLTFKSA
jgi:hypothetical protein